MAAPAKRQKINLSNMPVIDLTQRSGISRDVRSNAATASDQNNNSGGRHDSNNPSPESGSRFTRLVPRPDDEPPVVSRLSGHTISCYTELCGWSVFTPQKFFNIRDSTRMPSMTDGRGEVLKVAEELRPKCITLREMDQLKGGINHVVSCPIFVHVVAKRKVDIVPYNNGLLVIPLVVIADESGYCVMCSMNEGLATIYNEVEVGDQLLITRCLPQLPRRVYHRGLFSEDMFLNLELKLQFHSVRNHYIWRFSPLKVVQFKMPLLLFDSTCQVKLPSELEEEFQRPPVVLPWITPAPANQYYDVVGVVVHVGRIERFKNTADTQNVECVEDGHIIVKRLERFLQYRWIYLVDRTSKPFPVKVYVNNANLSQQPALVPGAILVLSHCQTSECPYSGRYTSTSQFSQMYLEGNIEKYYMLHPPLFREKTGQLLIRQNYIDIMLRTDIQFTIGGSHATMILNPQKFLAAYFEYRQKVSRIIPVEADRPLARRESRRLFFEGKILRVFSVYDENRPSVHYIDREEYSRQMLKKEGNEYEVVENFYSYNRHKNTSWYAFQRKLPPFDPSVLLLQKCREIVKSIVTTYKPFCGPLLMPAVMPDYQVSGPPPAMADLEKVDGPPYLLMDIVNAEDGKWHTVIWRNRQFTFEEMLKRIDESAKKKILCVAEIFCTEPDAPLEVNLLDFVVCS